MFSCKFIEIFKNTFFVEHLQAPASVLFGFDLISFKTIVQYQSIFLKMCSASAPTIY